MPRIKDVCRHVRSKNAGPFWVTFDLFFSGVENFDKFSNSPTLGPELFERLYGFDPEKVKLFRVPSLNMLKVSCARNGSQGGVIERDMHCGQQYVKLLEVDISE